ncbi:Serine/arginine repetitive matrix protein 1 [Rhodotorula toruloides ATCC 204091]|uniref:Serine/arginine repetitive matrix protein 1 n=1 Tax=Rhodotorula toruloides TaxID=5286 RepID=A0A0K3CNE5_RHOTO|nr:Serine/arginine repetitive matrix protein 1 [Rhodotorula toruloides ATCC 204091]KAK4335900.1 Serine/arginine repetitive matrix protein 1 [Rhodotorula toruloides]PRQ70164.1 Serine/arginine repetitive matrix protein 1 [Rhodotorula toruloides]
MTGPASPANDSTSTKPLLLQQAGTSTCAAVVLDSFARAAEGESFGPWEYSALREAATKRAGEDDDGLERLAEEMGMLLTPETEKSGCDWTTPEEEAGGECCCLSAETEAKTVRLVPGFEEDGNVGRTVADLHFDVLRRAKVIPETATPSSFANTLQFSSHLSTLLTQRRLTLLPHHDQLSTRLAFEYTYQLSRLRSLQTPSSSSRSSKRPRIPARPDFEHHYAALERQGAIVRPFFGWTCGRGVFERCDERGERRKYRLNSVDEAFEFGAEEEGKVEAKDAPPIPWYRLPCSMNLLLYAMADRMQQNAPAPEAVQEETEALSTGTRLLLSFWHLTSSTPTSSLSSLLTRTKSWLTTHLDSSSFPRFIERVDATMRAEEFLTPVPGWCIQEGVGWEKLEMARRRAVGEGGAPAQMDRIAALQKELDDPDLNTSTPGSQTPSTSTSALTAPTAEQKERQEFVRAWMAQLAS